MTTASTGRLQRDRDSRHPRYWPSRGGLWLLRGLTRCPVSWQTKIGRLLGRVAKQQLGQRRHIVERNLELCFPDLDVTARQRLLQRHFEAAGVSILEMATAWSGHLDQLDAELEIRGSDHFEAARQRANGILLLGGHFLSMEIAGALFARRWPVDVVYRRQHHPVLDAAERKGRSRHFQALIEHQQIREVVRRLRAGHSVWFAADQDQGRQGAVFAPFFGIEAATLTSPLRLARLTGATVLLIDMWRNDMWRKDMWRKDKWPANEGKRWTLRFRPLPDGFPSGDHSADAGRLNASIEAAVREHPEQYLWLHRRFKTRPQDAPSVY